ncbi:MAG: Na(+)-translocating NADH-quinone reductase subunit A [Gammaproteobacteria bacterium]
MRIKVRRGLDLPIQGDPQQVIEPARAVGSVAVLGRDYLDLRPSMQVQEGDRVRLGQPLFSDRRRPGVTVTAPAPGVVTTIRRGARRVLQSVIITLDGDEEVTFRYWTPGELPALDRDVVIENLTTSGLWCAMRARPWSKVPDPSTSPHALFINAMDTNPLAPDPTVIIREAAEDFVNGVAVLSRLTSGATFLCKAEGADVPVPDSVPGLQVAEFSGPHPAGLVGTHIHCLYPVSPERIVWHLGYQDVIAIGRLFTTGRVDTTRVISLAGPTVKRPRLLKTRLGAHIEPLVVDEIEEDIECRVLSGSVWSGYRATGWAGFLGRYHQQVTVLAEGRKREFIGWLHPGGEKFSVTRAFLSSFSSSARRFALSTSQNGSPRAMVPIGSYERVMPLDLLPTQLLRALIVGDTDEAQRLGALELDEEDLALCTFVCPGKYDYGPVLRERLEQIEKEG